MSSVRDYCNTLLAHDSWWLSIKQVVEDGIRKRPNYMCRTFQAGRVVAVSAVAFLLVIFVICLLLYAADIQPLNIIASRHRHYTVKKSVNSSKHELVLKFNTNSTIQLTSSMKARELDANFFQYVSTLHYDCEDYIRLGNSYDGGWDMCLVGPYRPTQPCLIYSFGISWDFSFDDAASIRFNCTVRSFDPSMTDATDRRRGPNIWFYPTGIGGKDETTSDGWTLNTLQTIMEELNDTEKTIDYLKLDVENAEWECLPNMISTGVLDQVKQFALEIHVTSKDFYRFWTILDALEQQGFRRWYWAMNFRGSNIYMEKAGSRSYCYEMVYINTKYINAGTR